MVEVVGTGKEEGCSKFRARELEGEEGGGMAAEVGLREGPADIWSSKYSGLREKEEGKEVLDEKREEARGRGG